MELGVPKPVHVQAAREMSNSSIDQHTVHIKCWRYRLSNGVVEAATVTTCVSQGSQSAESCIV